MWLWHSFYQIILVILFRHLGLKKKGVKTHLDYSIMMPDKIPIFACVWLVWRKHCDTVLKLSYHVDCYKPNYLEYHFSSIRPRITVPYPPLQSHIHNPLHTESCIPQWGQAGSEYIFCHSVYSTGILLSEELESLILAAHLLPLPQHPASKLRGVRFCWLSMGLWIYPWCLNFAQPSLILSHLYYILWRFYKISDMWLVLVLYFQCGINISLWMEKMGEVVGKVVKWATPVCPVILK